MEGQDARESLLEGLYALRRRLGGKHGSMAEAYGCGKLLGMVAPWAVDGASRWLGVDVFDERGLSEADRRLDRDVCGARPWRASAVAWCS
jgi:hypothetical protein